MTSLLATRIVMLSLVLLDGFNNGTKPLTNLLKATRGPIHDYLGMNINFSTPGSVSFDMIPYITKVMTDFP
jgi:hypothetical protein